MEKHDFGKCVWAKNRRCFKIAVDNSSTAGIISGHEKLTIDHLRSHCIRIANQIYKLINGGWSLFHWAADPVVWVPRELNHKADSLCNKSMNMKQNHRYIHPQIDQIIRTGFNLKLCTDGGVRGGKTSGTGWVIYAVQVDDVGAEGKHVAVIEGGFYYDRGMSSLEAEIRALKEALTCLGMYL